MPKFDIPLTLIQSAAIVGIGFAWINFTVKAFKMTWHIISSSLEDDLTQEEETFWDRHPFEDCLEKADDL